MLIVRPKSTCEEKSMETAAIVRYVRRRKSTINDQHPLPHTTAGHHPIISVRPSVCLRSVFRRSVQFFMFSAPHSERRTTVPSLRRCCGSSWNAGTSQHPVVQLLYDVTSSRHDVYCVQHYSRVLVYIYSFILSIMAK